MSNEFIKAISIQEDGTQPVVVSERSGNLIKFKLLEEGVTIFEWPLTKKQILKMQKETADARIHEILAIGLSKFESQTLAPSI